MVEEERSVRSNHRRKFLADNADLIPVVGSPDEALLRWAKEHRLLQFTRFEGEEFYRAVDVELAKMWKDKYRDGVPIGD